MGMAHINRNAPQQSKKRLQDWFMIKLLVDNISDRATAGELQDDGIDPGDVVGQKKKSALRQIVDSESIDSIKTTRQHPAEERERAFSGGLGSHRLSFTINAGPSAIGNWRWKAV